MSKLYIEPSDGPDALRRRGIAAVADQGVGDRALWYQPYATDAIRAADAGSTWGDGDASRVVEIYQRAAKEVLLSLGDHLHRPPRDWTGRFVPGSEVWHTRDRLQASPFYTSLMRAARVEDQLRLLVYDGRRFVAHVGLYRGPGDPAFDASDAERLAPLVAGLRTLFVAASRLARSRLPEESGDALLGAGGRFEMVSSVGRAWIARAAVRHGLRRLVRRLETAPAHVGEAVVAGVRVGWVRMDGRDGVRYLVQLRRPPPWTESRFARLSPRQRQVAELLAHGATLSDTARLLDVSFETARTHAHAAYRGLGVRRRSELLDAWRAEHG